MNDADIEVTPLPFCWCVTIPGHRERDKLMDFFHDADTCDMRCVVIFQIILRGGSMRKNLQLGIVLRMSTGVVWAIGG